MVVGSWLFGSGDGLGKGGGDGGEGRGHGEGVVYTDLRGWVGALDKDAIIYVGNLHVEGALLIVTCIVLARFSLSARQSTFHRQS